MNYRILFFAIFFSSLFCISCLKDELDPDVSVFTEEVVFSSGERAILTGRVLAQGAVNVSDQSLDESFSSPIIISLGEKDKPGRFVGETNDLNITLDYVCRSYIVVDGQTEYGNILQFSTLTPRLVDFNPKEGTRNTKIIIEGRNLTSQTKVFWNGIEISPIDIIAETFIEFSVPAIGDEPFGVISIQVEGETFESPDVFEYIIGDWIEEGPLEHSLNSTGHVYFESGDDFVYGLGNQTDFNGPSTRFRIVDKETLAESEIMHIGDATEGSFYADGYFGSGSFFKVRILDDALSLTSQFWHYNAGEFTELATPIENLYKASAIKVGDLIYVYGGEDAARNLNTDIYTFNTTNNDWNNIGDSPIWTTSEYPIFNIDNHIYLITPDGNTHRHNIDDGSWDTVAPFPEEVKIDGINIVFKDKAYVGMMDLSRRVFEYSPDEDKWRPKTALNTINQYLTKGAWVHNDRIYVMRTNLGSGTDRQIFSFDPDKF